MDDLIKRSATINKLLARYGVKFGIYKNGEFKEQLFPFDPIPRIIAHDEFSFLERGLKQRVDALNCFLRDIYGAKQIVRDGVIPEEFVFSVKGYLPPCDGVMPPKGIYSHISGIDLVQSKNDSWYILEDNLRVPSGASYPMIAREFQRKSAPEAFLHNRVIDNRNYWYGFDPTNNLLVDDRYLRAACGRDSADCAVIRGTFYGSARQTQREQVSVQEENV